VTRSGPPTGRGSPPVDAARRPARRLAARPPATALATGRSGDCRRGCRRAAATPANRGTAAARRVVHGAANGRSSGGDGGAAIKTPALARRNHPNRHISPSTAAAHGPSSLNRCWYRQAAAPSPSCQHPRVTLGSRPGIARRAVTLAWVPAATVARPPSSTAPPPLPQRHGAIARGLTGGGAAAGRAQPPPVPAVSLRLARPCAVAPPRP